MNTVFKNLKQTFLQEVWNDEIWIFNGTVFLEAENKIRLIVIFIIVA